MESFKVFSGSTNPQLSQDICNHIGVELSEAHCSQFSDGESRVYLEESIRGDSVYIIQSTCAPANDSLMELLLLIDATRRASAAEINVVTPYFGYARQDKKVKPREPITASLVANLIQTAGADKLFAVDLHAEQIQGFFQIPVDHLYAGPVLADHLMQKPHGKNLAVVSPDVSGVARARSLSECLGASLVIIAKRRPEPNQVSIIELIGNVKNKDCVIIDDMIDTGKSVIAGAEMLIQNGAKSVEVVASHGIFSADAAVRLQESAISSVTILDTIPVPGYKLFPKLTVCSSAALIAEAIIRDTTHRSVSELFKEWRS